MLRKHRKGKTSERYACTSVGGRDAGIWGTRVVATLRKAVRCSRYVVGLINDHGHSLQLVRLNVAMQKPPTWVVSLKAKYDIATWRNNDSVLCSCSGVGCVEWTTTTGPSDIVVTVVIAALNVRVEAGP